MKLPFVSRARYLLMVAAANTASVEREHERRRAERMEARYDDLLRSYMALRREGFVIPTPVIHDDTEAAIASVDDADLIAASKQPVMDDE